MSAVKLDRSELSLSLRQHEVLMLLARGFTRKEIQEHLGLCRTTVDVHVRKLLEKLDAKNPAQAIVNFYRTAGDRAFARLAKGRGKAA